MADPKWEDTTPSESADAAPTWESTEAAHPTTGDYATKAIAGVGKTLDYAGGMSRAALATGISKLLGKNLVKPGETALAASPTTSTRFPDSATLMARAGVPAGPSVSDVAGANGAPPMLRGAAALVNRMGFNPNARDAAGVVSDAATDPLTYAAGGMNKLAELGEKAPGWLGRVLSGGARAARATAVDPVATAGRKASTDLYESGIRPIIQAGERYGNPNVGKTMKDAGIWGSPPAIEAGMESAAGTRKAARDAILDQGEQAGAVSSKNNALTPMADQLMDLIKDQRLTPDQASKILQDVSAAKMQGPDGVSPKLMTQWKTDIGNALPGSTWDELSKTSPSMANQVKQTAQTGYRKEVERSLNAAQAGLGDQLAAENRPLGDLINAHVQGAASTMAGKYERQPLLSSSDIMTTMLGGAAGGVGAGGTSHTIEGGLAALALKKAINAGQSTAFRTGAGLAGDRILNSAAAPAIDAATRRAVIKKFSPYTADDKEN